MSFPSTHIILWLQYHNIFQIHNNVMWGLTILCGIFLTFSLIDGYSNVGISKFTNHFDHWIKLKVVYNMVSSCTSWLFLFQILWTRLRCKNYKRSKWGLSFSLCERIDPSKARLRSNLRISIDIFTSTCFNLVVTRILYVVRFLTLRWLVLCYCINLDLLFLDKGDWYNVTI